MTATGSTRTPWKPCSRPAPAAPVAPASVCRSRGDWPARPVATSWLWPAARPAAAGTSCCGFPPQADNRSGGVQVAASTLRRMRKMLNKVPEVTLYFWVIKVLSTTVGETGADNLNSSLNLGLSKTTYVMGALLLIALGGAVRDAEVRATRVLGGRRADQHRRHADHGQPGRQLRRGAGDDHDRCSASPSRSRSPSGTGASERSRSTRSARLAARRSTGSRSCSRSRSARRRATWSPSASGSAT